MSLNDRLALGGAGGALLLVVVAGWLLLAPAEGADDGSALADPSSFATVVPAPSATPPADLVVDVEGGVVQPGLHRLPPASRVGDAIAAAGGYGPSADLEAAARALNLAALLSDGEQVYVPRLGDGDAAPAASGAGSDGSGDGLVDLNSATPEELDGLPGIGPVTVEKIVAAREERPFASLEEAVERGVLNRGQLDKIRELATAR